MSVFEDVAPRLARAHKQRREELRRARTRPCGREGWCCACWVVENRRNGSRTRREPTPWIYNREDRRYGFHAYTLLIHPGGFMQRIYDFELEHDWEWKYARR
jgi:hypothetical protein